MSLDQSDASNNFRDELTEILRTRLIESGWRNDVTNLCRDIIQKHGIEQIKLEQIVTEVTPKAREMIPDEIKTDMVAMIKRRNSPTTSTAVIGD